MAEQWRTEFDIVGWKQNGTTVESYFDFVNDALVQGLGANLTGRQVAEIGTICSYKVELLDKEVNYTCIEPCHGDIEGNVISPYSANAETTSVYKVLENAYATTEYENSFDAIISIHMLEHINPLDSQYNIWKNLHSMCKVNGVMIYILPDADECFNYLRQLGHSNLYFGRAFFAYLADKLGYEILNNQLLNYNRSVALKKVSNVTFDLDVDEFKSKILN
ncbi:hypothetical protein EBU71_12825 [bacterium]|nr:hypothetical protein [Candidatus Elulimicrobium humile]